MAERLLNFDTHLRRTDRNIAYTALSGAGSIPGSAVLYEFKPALLNTAKDVIRHTGEVGQAIVPHIVDAKTVGAALAAATIVPMYNVYRAKREHMKIFRDHDRTALQRDSLQKKTLRGAVKAGITAALGYAAYRAAIPHSLLIDMPAEAAVAAGSLGYSVRARIDMQHVLTSVDQPVKKSPQKK